MAVVETERHGQVLVVRMNRPERLNALNQEMRTGLAETWTEFRHSDEFEVAIFTGTGRGVCAGEDMRESLQRGVPGGQRPAIEDPFMSGALEKPVIAAVNGYAMGGGFMLVERTDLRVAVREAVFEVSEAKRWLLGGYNHGHVANLPYPIAMEMALGFRLDRKSTRLNSSHRCISYAVFCLKKKTSLLVGARSEESKPAHCS